MAVVPFGRVCIVLCLLQWCVFGYEIPDVRIQALNPRGFRASIPHAPNVSLFAFQGNVNRAISSNQVGTLSGEVVEPTDGRWVFQDPNIELKPGDVINYYVFVSVDGAGYLKDKLSFTVSGLETATDPLPSPTQPTLTPTPVPTQPPTPRPTPPTPKPTEPAIIPVTSNPNNQGNKECGPTVTMVRGGRACAGQIIFEDDFSSLREDVWQIEQYIPFEHPEYPFVTYQRSSVSVADGMLRIAPTLQQNLPGYNNESMITGELNLFSG